MEHTFKETCYYRAEAAERQAGVGAVLEAVDPSGGRTGSPNWTPPREERRAWVSVMTLSFSRHMYAGREVGGIGFWQYLRIGLPLALTTTAAGASWISFVG